MTDSALDRILPDYQFVERHSVLVHARREAVWRALHEVGLIRRDVLRAVRRRAEHSSPGSQP